MVPRYLIAGTLLLAVVSGVTACGDAGKPHPARTGSVTMPDLVGKNGAVAKDDLERLGFADNRIKLSPENRAFVAMPSHWTVAAQSERPGTRVSLQELIVLSVDKMRHPWRHHD
ncbi:hypothetical protein GCM10029978_065140 [Actinoallomurus acanthiterrae]